MPGKAKTLSPQRLARVADNFQRDVEQALRRLITLRTGGDAELASLFDDIQIQWMAEEYQDFVYRFQSVGNTKKQAIKLLKGCRTQTSELITTLNMLIGGGWREFYHAYEDSAKNRKKLSFYEIEELLIDLHSASLEADKVVAAWPDRRGPLPDMKPLEVARVAAAQYARITQKEPTRVSYGGPDGVKGWFPDFLREVFKALGITASVDASAKDAVEWWKRRDPLQLPNRDRMFPSPTESKVEK